MESENAVQEMLARAKRVAFVIFLIGVALFLFLEDGHAQGYNYPNRYDLSITYQVPTSTGIPRPPSPDPFPGYAPVRKPNALILTVEGPREPMRDAPCSEQGFHVLTVGGHSPPIGRNPNCAEQDKKAEAEHRERISNVFRNKAVAVSRASFCSTPTANATKD